MRRLLLAAALSLSAAACGCSSGSTAAAPPGASPDAASDGWGDAPSDAVAEGGGAIDPGLFDCTAKKVPDRVASTPVACGLDPKCLVRQVAGHRGAGGDLGKIAPEDTLAAYRAAIALGADYVETDPRPTKDGVIVNLHDPTVDRTTTGKGKVDEMTFAEIRALGIKASQFAGDFSCEKVPTLEEILETCKGRVVVLVDANKTDKVDLLVKAIQKTGALDWAIFDTSSVAKIDQAIALEPGLRTQIRVTSVADLDGQLDHFAAHPPVIVEIESGSPVSDIAAKAHARGNRALLDVFFQDAAAALDGDVGHYAEPFGWGIDIAQSDRPELVLKFLGRK